MAASMAPQNVSKLVWYYEYPTYLLLVHEIRDQEGNYLRTDSFKIHWRRIQQSLKRAYRPRKTRAKQ